MRAARSALMQVLCLIAAGGGARAHEPTPIVPAATPTAVLNLVAECPGDCSGDGVVTINDLITGVNIALGLEPISDCEAFDVNGDGEVTVDDSSLP